MAIMWLSLIECVGRSPSRKSASRQNIKSTCEIKSPRPVFTQGSAVGSKLRFEIKGTCGAQSPDRVSISGLPFAGNTVSVIGFWAHMNLRSVFRHRSVSLGDFGPAWQVIWFRGLGLEAKCRRADMLG